MSAAIARGATAGADGAAAVAPAPAGPSRLGAHLAGFAAMAVCGPATLVVVLALGQLGSALEEEPSTREVSFAIEPPPPRPRPKPREAEPRRAPERARERAPLAAAPDLDADLGGVELDLAGLSVAPDTRVDESLLGDLDGAVHTEATVDQKPVPSRTTPIAVPASARARHLSGQVVLSLLIGADGTVKKVKVLEAEPPGVFDQAAVDAVRRWSFEPGRYGGRPVEMWATLPIRFDP